MVHRFENNATPPPVFKCKLEQLRLNHPDKPTLEVLAAAVGITPLTLIRIQNGGDLKMSNAWKIAKLFGMTPQDIWEPIQ